MRISFCSIGFQKNKWGKDRAVEVPLRDILPLLGHSGARYDGVEVWYPHVEGFLPQAVAQLRAQLAAERLAVPMLSSYYDFTSTDESAAASVAHARDVIAMARAIGAGAIRIFTGKTGSAAATPQHWTRGVQALQTVADAAAAEGLRLACETHAHNLMDSVDSSLLLVQRAARKNLGLILQPSTFKANYLDACATLAPHAFHVHATNSLAGKGTTLAQGEMDYRQIVAVLRKHQFPGFISVEWMGADPAGVAQTEAPYLRSLIHGGDAAGFVTPTA